MKHFFNLFILLVLYSNSYCQINQGTIKYKVQIGEDDLFKSMPKEMQEEYKNDLESESYILVFSDKNSIFSLEKGIDINYEIEYYKDIDSTFSLRQNSDKDLGELIIKENRNVDWKINFEETKTINNFKCYKATSSYTITRGYKTFTFPLIAWFSPEIPISTGPLGYGGLPGLILELQDRITLYGATYMSFEKPKERIIKPFKGKLVSQEEYNSLLNEKFKKSED